MYLSSLYAKYNLIMLIFKNNIEFCITKDSEATYLGVSQYIFPNQYKKRKN